MSADDSSMPIAAPAGQANCGHETEPIGLVLTGGGARAAYQVGVLQEIADMRRRCAPQNSNPFAVICGTSAGAINASMLACGADRYDAALQELAQIWDNFQSQQVYRADLANMISSGARWISLLSLGWLISQKQKPKSLLDNTPLLSLLKKHIDFQRLPQLLKQGHLQSLAISASSYGSSEHVTFYQSVRPVEAWVRNQRIAVPTQLQHQHLLASAGIPFLFPAAVLQGPYGCAWYGDGAMRQTAPIAPAIHLGASKILVISVARLVEPPNVATLDLPDYPSLANVAGHVLSSIFLDSLSVDVERLQRINTTLRLIPEDKRTQSSLRPIELLHISPSQRVDSIAARHADALPTSVQRLLRVLGARAKLHQQTSGALISYLLFESVYTRELMALGRADARAQSQAIHSFFGWSH